MEWLSAHIFYHDPPDPLLVHCIGPLIQTCKQTHHVHRSFFLRYWKGGPHIRLRMQADAHVLESLVKPCIEEMVGRYLAEHPSRNTIAAEQIIEAHHHLSSLEYEDDPAITPYPNNSIQYIAYEPEYQKYGGPAGVEIAETLFDRSTDVALTALASCIGNPQQRLGIGFALMVIALRAFDLPLSDMRFMVSQYYRRWEPYLPDALPRFEGEWQKQYASQRPALRKIALSVFSDRFAKDRALSGWWNALRDVREQVAAVARQMLPEHPRRALGLLLSNYIHTMNNRLGIEAARESYLGYLVDSALGEPEFQHAIAGLEETRRGTEHGEVLGA